MPYIKEEVRAAAAVTPMTEGELNYAITRLCWNFTRHREGYSVFNQVVGALELAKQEYIRRIVSPYEDKKCAENGDVYE